MSGGPHHPFWTVPNILCLIRLVCAPLLLMLAGTGLSGWFVAGYLVLAFTDLIDGPLARKWNQRTEIGAGLDSAADITLSSVLVIGVLVLRWESVANEFVWIVAAMASYGVAVILGFAKFGRFPAYHTWSAKINHLLVVVAGLCVLLGESTLPLRGACITTLLANLENMLITALSRRWRADVPSVFLLGNRAVDETGKD